MLCNSTAERLFDALARFPHLSTEDRARIANAAEARHPATWRDAKEVRLDTGTLSPFRLAEAVRWEPLPTASQIIAGLNHAAGVLT